MLDAALDWMLIDVIGLDAASRLTESIKFFIDDSIKIILLIFIMIGIIGFLRTYVPHKKLKKLLSNTRYGLSNLSASIFGAVTPFCSCSSIPIFLSFLKVGVPLGVNFSFLITSPIINEYLVVLMLGFFGWKITLAYVFMGLFIGTVSGMILGKMNLERYLIKDISDAKNMEIKEIKYIGIKSRVLFGIDEATSMIKKLWIWILVGVGLGAIIHNYIPASVIQSIVERGGYLAVPIAVLVGVPMYGSCAAIVPVALVLFQKGVPLGTALAFMMAISALSLPEAIILRRAMNLRLILIFFGVVTLAIILTGYLFNILQNVLI